MAQTKLMGIEEARKKLGECVKAAKGEENELDAAPPGEVVHPVITRHGQPQAVLISIDDYREYRRLKAEPTDI